MIVTPMTDEQIEKEVTILVQDEDGNFHRAMLAPDLEPGMGGEVEPIVAAVEPLEVIETVPADAFFNIDEVADELDETHAAPTDSTSPPNPRSGSMMTPDELAEYDSETVRLVSAQESLICEFEAELTSVKERVKAAKKDVEYAKDQLRELIQNRDRERGRKPAPTLFDAPAQPASDRVNDAEPIDPHKELWREFPITIERWKDWKLTAKDVERLNSGETKNSGTHPIRVMGDVTRFITPNESSPGFARTLKDFKGFGDAAYDRWLHAEEQFWNWWNKGGKEEFAAELVRDLAEAI